MTGLKKGWPMQSTKSFNWDEDFNSNAVIKYKKSVTDAHSIAHMWPNFGKSTIWVHFTHEIFSSQKKQLNLKFCLIVDWVHYRHIKL